MAIRPRDFCIIAGILKCIDYDDLVDAGVLKPGNVADNGWWAKFRDDPITTFCMTSTQNRQNLIWALITKTYPIVGVSITHDF